MSSGVWQWLFEPWSRRATRVMRKTSRLCNTAQHQIASMRGWWQTQSTGAPNKYTKAKRPIYGRDMLPPSQSKITRIAIGCSLNTSILWVMAAVVLSMKVRATRQQETDVAWCVPSATLSFAGCVVNHGKREAAASPTEPCPAGATEESYRVQMTLSLALSQQALESECARDAP
jgi:hypothetical protein